MNIYTQVCGIIILLIVLFFYSVQHKIYLNTEKAFLNIVFALMISCIADIVSVVAIVRQDIFSVSLTNLCCKVYLVTIVYVITSAMIYISMDIYKNTKAYHKAIGFYIAFFVVSSIVLMIVPVYYSVGQEGVQYSYGPSTLVTYAATLFMMCAVLFRVYTHRTIINPNRRVAVTIWIGLWIGAAAVQFFFPSILVVSFSGCVGAMILYIKLENPEMNINKQTGLFNLNAFMEYVKQQYGAGHKFTLISVTLNNYIENIFDNKFAWENIWQSFSAKQMLAFRKAEDEMIFIFENMEQAHEWGLSLSKSLANRSNLEGLVLRQAAWTCIPDSAMLSGAEELFYFMKYINSRKRDTTEKKERNLIVADEDMVKEMRKEKEVEKLIDDALGNGWVEVFYQPIYSTSEQGFSSAEALARIRDEQGNIIPPAEFIPVAESSGKIIELGKEVFDQVCSFIKQNDIIKHGVKYIEVNLSVVQCADEDLADTYISIMEKHNISPEYINLEITESASLKSKEILLNNMEKLIEYGVNFSLDDFGTGQSNLNYILDMPVEIVKFDRYMINAYFGNGKARYVMDAAMHMIHGMGLQIVSEGIETEEQFKEMDNLGIAYIQGYYFSRPLPQKDFLEFIMNNSK